jgi:hypothetical protein
MLLLILSIDRWPTNKIVNRTIPTIRRAFLQKLQFLLLLLQHRLLEWAAKEQQLGSTSKNKINIKAHHPTSPRRASLKKEIVKYIQISPRLI